MNKSINPFVHGVMLTAFILVMLYDIIRSMDATAATSILCCIILPLYAVVVAILENMKEMDW